nr:MAG TPA: hypothetical protein [Bacteriophage sp.]
MISYVLIKHPENKNLLILILCLHKLTNRSDIKVYLDFLFLNYA